MAVYRPTVGSVDVVLEGVLTSPVIQKPITDVIVAGVTSKVAAVNRLVDDIAEGGENTWVNEWTNT